ncbi:MAG: helix-turn-helix domain-containing protein [Acidimicrobiales bacterium]|nr:helix-turn-helix domain-containing protein [Acidimicrobiales bacterium]
MKSVQSTITVFETVALHQPIGLSELSRRLGIPKSTVQRTLNTLRDAGWLRHDLAERGQWVVTAHFAALAELAPVAVAVRDASHDHLQRLRAECATPVGLFMLDGVTMAAVAGLRAPLSQRDVEVAFGPLPVHVSAGGRAILSRLPVATRKEALGSRLQRHTPHSLTDVRAILTEIERAEELGYAVVRDEFRVGITSVAAAVLDRRSLPLAAVTLLCSTDSADDDRVATLGAAAIRGALAVGESLRSRFDTDDRAKR